MVGWGGVREGRSGEELGRLVVEELDEWMVVWDELGSTGVAVLLEG